MNRFTSHRSVNILFLGHAGVREMRERMDVLANLVVIKEGHTMARADILTIKDAERSKFFFSADDSSGSLSRIIGMGIKPGLAKHFFRAIHDGRQLVNQH